MNVKEHIKDATAGSARRMKTLFTPVEWIVLALVTTVAVILVL